METKEGLWLTLDALSHNLIEITLRAGDVVFATARVARMKYPLRASWTDEEFISQAQAQGEEMSKQFAGWSELQNKIDAKLPQFV